MEQTLTDAPRIAGLTLVDGLTVKNYSQDFHFLLQETRTLELI